MNAVQKFFKLDSATGIMLMAATALALICSNTALQPLYNKFIHTNMIWGIGDFTLEKPLLLWINDGLMAVFFFMIGLELKREFTTGHLTQLANVVLPGISAIGGIAVPALIFVLFNLNYPENLRGWAIPTATDIAFALGILSLSSDKVPIPVKLFLLTLAIFDDLAAIIIIAVFYTAHISMFALVIAAFGLLTLFIMNRANVTALTPYILVAIFLWFCLMNSGVHATLAGVISALFIPANEKTTKLEHDLHPWVSFFILPLFAFSNTGLDLINTSIDAFIRPITLGTALGLFLGKQIGVFGFCWLYLVIFKVKHKVLPFTTIYGLALLSGIGFTMSLFISTLSYNGLNLDSILQARLGILCGSLLSAIAGILVLRSSFKKYPH